ncbi:hypothetical protein PIB30_011076 [Stylosanthes scabra]|uniref:Putative plant transposon protein domain-containing protein n=1 Tax=Stylosanthes scabra TaxID=79078 RepID=A0ABU6X5S1_9FABA|nr:hypothetical protein [Stylosanthes scabra]
MARKGKETASTSTSSRARNTKNSIRGRSEAFPADRFDNQIHYDKLKSLEHWGYTHERVIHFDDKHPDFFQRREFCANYSSPDQETVFLRGVKITFKESDICRNLGIHIDLPGPDVDDAFVEITKRREANSLNMDEVFQVISPLDHAILNSHASAWHKLIMANIDPKTHGTTFDMNHTLLIYVLMTEGVVNLPRIMRDILLTRPMKDPRNLLPYPVFISRLVNQYEVPEYAGDQFYTVREVEMSCPYGNWKGERATIHKGRVVSPRHPPRGQQAE